MRDKERENVYSFFLNVYVPDPENLLVFAKIPCDIMLCTFSIF
jgi:hypothetical protein